VIRFWLIAGVLALVLASWAAADSVTPTARCTDGTLSYSSTHSGTCSHHGGVAEWLGGSPTTTTGPATTPPTATAPTEIAPVTSTPATTTSPQPVAATTVAATLPEATPSSARGAGLLTIAAARRDLTTLEKKPDASKAGYTRAQFGPAWADTNHNGCDTRDDILRRDLVRIAFASGSSCIVESGALNDPYSGKTIAFVRGVATSARVQIDHVVPLEDAWVTGANRWTATEREQYANDPLELLAVDGQTNEAKGDKDASAWLPPNEAFDCASVDRQVSVKTRYRLWVTRAEETAMADVLAHC
jgi:hypothetical protein